VGFLRRGHPVFTLLPGLDTFCRISDVGESEHRLSSLYPVSRGKLKLSATVNQLPLNRSPICDGNLRSPS
jgi:hypothetical protein